MDYQHFPRQPFQGENLGTLLVLKNLKINVFFSSFNKAKTNRIGSSATSCVGKEKVLSSNNKGFNTSSSQLLDILQHHLAYSFVSSSTGSSCKLQLFLKLTVAVVLLS